MSVSDLGQLVRQLRREHSVTQQARAAHLDIWRATLDTLKTGRATDIDLSKVMRILEYLGMELNVRPKSPLPTFEELRDDH